MSVKPTLRWDSREQGSKCFIQTLAEKIDTIPIEGILIAINTRKVYAFWPRIFTFGDLSYKYIHVNGKGCMCKLPVAVVF